MNCWYTMARLRLLTGTPVTSTPSAVTVPPLGLSRPAITRIRVVLPARVVPSKTLMAPGTSASDIGYKKSSAPCFLLILSSTSCTRFSSSDVFLFFAAPSAGCGRQHNLFYGNTGCCNSQASSLPAVSRGRCRPSLERRHRMSAALKAHSWRRK